MYLDITFGTRLGDNKTLPENFLLECWPENYFGRVPTRQLYWQSAGGFAGNHTESTQIHGKSLPTEHLKAV